MFKAIGNMFRLLGLARRLRRYGALRALTHMDVIPSWLPTLLRITTFYVPRKSGLPDDDGERLAMAFASMGPSYIKVGQTLSTRPDMVGELADGLATLQDRLPAFDGDDAIAIIEEELGGELSDHFASFEKEAYAAASIAQVHRATRTDGSEVAVKVLRPGIRKRFAKDVSLFAWLASLADKTEEGKRLRASEVVKTLERSISQEMDLRLEASAAAEIKANMVNQAGYDVPTVYWQETSERILTTEWVEGIKLSDVDALKAAGHDMEKLASTIIEAFLNQAMRDGFFHADLHPGNLLVRGDSTIIAVDFGIMGRLTVAERRYLAEILYGFLERDYVKVAELHFDAGYVPMSESLGEFAQALRAIAEPILDRPVEEMSAGTLLSQLFDTTARFQMQTQPQLLLLQRSMVMAEGLALQLHPKGNMFTLARPVLEGWIRDNLSPEVLIADMMKKLPALIERIPRFIDLMLEEKEEAVVSTPVRGDGYMAGLLQGLGVAFIIALAALWANTYL